MTFAHIAFDPYILPSQVPVIISDKLAFLERKRQVSQYFTNTGAYFYNSYSVLPPLSLHTPLPHCAEAAVASCLWTEVIPVRNRLLVNYQCIFPEEFDPHVLGACSDL